MEKDEFFSVVLRDTGLIVHDKTSHVQIIDDDSEQETFNTTYLYLVVLHLQLPVSISPS